MAKRDFLRELVPVTLFRDGGEYRDDAVVIVNGKTWIIRRGEPVMVPRFVALALCDAERQRQAARALMGRCEGSLR